MRAVRITIAIAAIATAASLIAAAPAGAHSTSRASAKRTPTATVLTTAVGAPFNLDVRNKKVLVADGGVGRIGRVEAGGSVATVVPGVAGASGVATSHDGRFLAYTTSTIEGETRVTASGLVIRGPKGGTVTADTLAYETAHNPDGRIRYGVSDPTPCVSETLTRAGLPVSYEGAIDSHAYSVAALRKGWVVADAGANALLAVSAAGVVSTLAVLPPQPTTITAAAATAFGLDDCAVGVSYAFEAVPTDVEMGADGFLYVTTLPGGPEDATLGARGSVYRVNPRNGHVKKVASGFVGATNLAILDGRIYVSELFAGRISRVSHGTATSYIDLPGALALEAGPKGSLYAATGITGAPSVVRIDLARVRWHR
jgi:hypothetical protein